MSATCEAYTVTLVPYQAPGNTRDKYITTDGRVEECGKPAEFSVTYLFGNRYYRHLECVNYCWACFRACVRENVIEVRRAYDL